MRTQQSKQYSNLLFGALNKVEFEEEAHPRDASGRFAPKGEAGAEAPAESAPRNLRSLAREASALRAMGEEAEARRVEQKLQALRGKAEAGRQARMPKPLAPPRPQPAPKPRPAPAPVPVPAPAPPPPPPAPPRAADPLPGTRPRDRDHEMGRIDDARDKAAGAANPRQKFKDLMVQRMNAIGKPEKMMHFGHALAHAGEPVLAQEAFDRLRRMGFDPDGRPIPGVAPGQAQHLAQPPKPAPPAPPAPPRAAPARPPLPSPDDRQKRHEKVAVDELKRRASDFDDLERQVRDRLLRVKNHQNDPQKVRNFANELEAQGEKYLAEEARNVLWEMGHKPDGSPVPEGERFARPPHGVARPTPPPPPPEAKPATGVKHPMQSVHDVADAIGRAKADFKGEVIKTKNIGGGIGETHRVEFKDGTKAIYKPTKGSGLQAYHDMGNDVRPGVIDWKISEAKREMVAYAISREAGFDVVPHVEEANFPVGSKGGGHAMAWVNGEEARSVDWGRDARRDHPDIHRIAAMDFITGNSDRHSRNFMKGADGRYYAIDNGLSVRSDLSVDTYISDPHEALTGRGIPDEVRAEIRAIRPEAVAEVMKKNGFPKDDIDGVLTRLEYLKKKSSWGKPREDLRAASR